MKSFLLMLPVFAAVIVSHAFAAQDPSIDRLLGKLPPPEKFVDPAIRDPLTKQMEAAAKANNYGAALDASRRLAARYPKSLGAQMMHGILAALLRRFPEASRAYRKAVSMQPDLATAYLGLGLAEFSQRHFGAALTNFRQVTRLAPKADIGWIGVSASEEKLGHRRESLEYGRRAVAVAPSSAGAWYQLARVEGLSGNKQASAKAFARANQLHRSAPRNRSSRPRGGGNSG